MTAAKSIVIVVTAALLPLLVPGEAFGQFGIPGTMSYPNSDFKWYWGSQRDLERRRGFEDFSIPGSDGGFNCALTGSFRPGSRYSSSEVRQMQSDLQTSLYFIESVANMMYVLDQRREIDWAELDCVKPASNESAAELREREDKARAKAERDRERRRARRERDEAN